MKEREVAIRFKSDAVSASFDAALVIEADGQELDITDVVRKVVFIAETSERNRCLIEVYPDAVKFSAPAQALLTFMEDGVDEGTQVQEAR